MIRCTCILCQEKINIYMKLFDVLFEYKSLPDMVNRLLSVYNLVIGGATEGERNAAKAAYDRTLAAIAREYGEDSAKKADQQVKSNTTAKPPPRPRPRTQEPPRQKTYKSSSDNTRQNYGGKNSYYHDPRSGWSFYILHFVDPDVGKRGSNKIWGYAAKNGRFVSFWGAYGKSIRTKDLSSDREALMQVAKKAAKGYRTVDIANNPAEYAYIFNQFSQYGV